MSGGYAVKGGARGGCPNLHGAEGGGRLGGTAEQPSASEGHP